MDDKGWYFGDFTPEEFERIWQWFLNHNLSNPPVPPLYVWSVLVEEPFIYRSYALKQHNSTKQY